MNLRKIIAICVTVIAFGGAGVLLYMTFLSSPKTGPATGGPADQMTEAGAEILPYGTTLNFSTLKKYNKNGKLFNYPVVTQSDIGSELQNIIK